MLDDVLLDIEPVALSADGLEFLDGLADQPEAAWYHRRRREALAAAGLVGAYNPMQPRGRDGKWIEVFGWVRWLKDGKWRRGQVKGWSPKDGAMLVKDDNGDNLVFGKNEIPRRIFSAPTPKASMQLPKPGAHGAGDVDAPGFSKIGGQGGSNPGGMYQVTSPKAVKADAPITPEMTKAALNFAGHGSKLEPLQLEVDTWDPLTGQSLGDNALITDESTGRTYSKIGNTFWDLGTNQTVTSEELFGAANSPRRSEAVGKMSFVGESDSLTFSDFATILSTARSLSGTKPGKDDKFYIKTAKSPEHAKNEALANYLYELGGVPVPETSIGSDGLTFASRIVEGEEIKELSEYFVSPGKVNSEGFAVLDQLRENFAFDAWLANWDVVGLDYDNVKVVDGVPYRIDAGGALMYRAQGSPKGSMFGSDVGELESLINPSINKQSTNVFGGIDDYQIKKGVDRLAAIAPQDIINAVESHGLDSALSDKLIARRAFILYKYDVDLDQIHPKEMPSLPPELPEPDILPPLPSSPSESDGPTPKVYPTDISAMYYNADAENFLPGAAPPDTATTAYVQYLQMFDDKKFAITAAEFQTGNDLFVVHNDAVWEIDEIVPAPGYDNVSRVDLVHAATGEKMTIPAVASTDTFPTFGGEEMSAGDAAGNLSENLKANYGALFRDYRNNTVNKYRSTQAAANATNILVPGMTMETVGVGIGSGKPLGDFTGRWVVDETDPLKVRAYKVIKVDASATGGYSPSTTIFHTHDMDGEEVTFTGNWFLRTGKPGSVVNETFDAIQARNLVAKTNEKNDANAPTTIAESNIPTPTDTVMQKLSASQGAVSDPLLDVLDQAILNEIDQPTSPDPIAEHEYFDPETQINKNLNVVGDVINAYDLDINNIQPHIGKKVYFRFITKTGDTKDRGVFTLEGAEPRYTDNPNYGLVLTFRDSTGREHKKKTRAGPYDDGTAHGEMFEIEGNIAPILQYTEKKDGTIVVNGEMVGSWEKTTPSSYWEKPKWVATINGKYTVSGKEFTTVGLDKRASVKSSVVPLLMAPGSGGSKPKTAKVKEIQKQIVLQQIAFGSKIKETTAEGNAVTLMDGAEVKLGMWTISKTDGKIGKIVATKVSPEAGVTGSVKVEYDDPSSPGKKYIKIRGASTLSAAISPDGELPPGSPLFAKVKLGDGSQPFASQEVFLGGLEPMSGPVVIMGIKPDGSIRVIAPDGSKKWVKASALTPNKDYSKEVIVEVDAEPGGVIAANDESWKTAPKAGKIPYAAPGGAVVSQPSNAVADYRKFAQARKLTRDNFVPSIGMKVRDEKGTQLVIVRQNKSFDSNPSTVYVVDPSVGGKPKARQPNRLWVDHSAELATWDGQPLPKVNGAHFTAHGGLDQTYPDGTTLYSYSEITYTHGGNRKKAIKYFLIKPDGTVSNVDATGATSQMAEWQVESMLGKGPAKVAYFDSTSTSKITVENPGSAQISKIWVHDGAPGALEDLKVQVAKEATITPLPGELVSDAEPEKFNGDDGSLTTLPKPTHAPDAGKKSGGPPPPAVQIDASKLAQPAVVHNAFSVGTAIPELKKKIATGDPGSRVIYAMGDEDYIEDMAIRLQSVVNAKTQEEMIEVRFRLLENRVDDLSNRLISNAGQAKTGGWNKTPLKSPKDIVVGDNIAVKISATTPEPDGGALKPTELENPNATVVNSPVLVGTTKNGLEAYRIDIVTAGGAGGSLIVENRATPSLMTYEWDSTKVIPGSYFDSSVNPDAMSMGWALRNDHSSGYETAQGHGAPDALGRKVVDPQGVGVWSTGSHAGSYRLRYDAGESSFMTVQLTHPASEKRPPNIYSSGGSPTKSKGIRHSVNGEVLIRVPADDPNALDKISAMMSAAGVPPTAQAQPTGRDLRKMALHKVFKQFNPTYTHMQRPDVTGDDDASAQAVLSLIDAQVKGHMPNQRNVTMDDIKLHVMPSGRMEVVLSDDVAHALTAKSNYKFAYHQLTRGYQPLIWTSKAETGLMSTDERMSAGIVVTGSSSDSDVTHDAGNRIFFRLSNSNKLQGHIVVSATALNKKLDNYWSPSDYWGRRHPENTAKQYLTANPGGGNEIKIKRMVDPEMMAFVLVSDYERASKIAELKAAGRTHINGRPVEEIWVTPDMVSAGDVDDLGVHYGTEIPLTSIPLEGTAPVSAPVVIAAGNTMTGNIMFNTTSDMRLS